MTPFTFQLIKSLQLNIRNPGHHKTLTNTATPFSRCSHAIDINYPLTYSYITYKNLRRNYNVHRPVNVWTRLIRIEFEFPRFAFNALFNSHSCRQALKVPSAFQDNLEGPTICKCMHYCIIYLCNSTQQPLHFYWHI